MEEGRAEHELLHKLKLMDMTTAERDDFRRQEVLRFAKPAEFFKYRIKCKGVVYSVLVPPAAGLEVGGAWGGEVTMYSNI